MQTDSNFQPDPAMTQMSESLEIFSGTLLIVYLAILIITAIGFWKMFTKAGIPGIFALIPIVNLFFIPQVGGKPAWWAIRPRCRYGPRIVLPDTHLRLHSRVRIGPVDAASE